jgi:hypothetical protein
MRKSEGQPQSSGEVATSDGDKQRAKHIVAAGSARRPEVIPAHRAMVLHSKAALARVKNASPLPLRLPK